MHNIGQQNFNKYIVADKIETGLIRIMTVRIKRNSILASKLSRKMILLNNFITSFVVGLLVYVYHGTDSVTFRFKLTLQIYCKNEESVLGTYDLMFRSCCVQSNNPSRTKIGLLVEELLTFNCLGKISPIKS